MAIRFLEKTVVQYPNNIKMNEKEYEKALQDIKKITMTKEEHKSVLKNVLGSSAPTKKQSTYKEGDKVSSGPRNSNK